MNPTLNNEPQFALILANSTQEAMEIPPLERLELKNVYVTHTGLILKGLRLIKASIFKNISKKRVNTLYRYSLYKLFTERSVKCKETCLVIHHHWANGYHHWICESLIKLSYINDKSILLIMPKEYPRFAFESLALLGYNNIILANKNTGWKCNNLIAITNPVSGHFDSTEIIRLRDGLLTTIDHSLSATHKKIYITRKNASLRKITNENEIHAILEQFGYEIIDTSNLTFKEQILLFSQCEILVSIHGAGLTNCLFMPKNSIVFELYREVEAHNDTMNLCYYRMTKALGLKYMIQFGKIDDLAEEVHPDRRNIKIDIQIFEKNLQMLEPKK